jgi:hypothetical protein
MLHGNGAKAINSRISAGMEDPAERLAPAYSAVSALLEARVREDYTRRMHAQDSSLYMQGQESQTRSSLQSPSPTSIDLGDGPSTTAMQQNEQQEFAENSYFPPRSKVTSAPSKSSMFLTDLPLEESEQEQEDEAEGVIHGLHHMTELVQSSIALDVRPQLPEGELTLSAELEVRQYICILNLTVLDDSKCR